MRVFFLEAPNCELKESLSRTASRELLRLFFPLSVWCNAPPTPSHRPSTCTLTRWRLSTSEATRLPVTPVPKRLWAVSAAVGFGWSSSEFAILLFLVHRGMA
eukprot:RCo024697